MSESFLFVRFSAIGDCVMSAYIATAIRSERPSAKLVWAVESRCAPVVDTHSLVNERVEFPRDVWRKRRLSPRTWNEQLRQFGVLRKMKFDFGLDLQGHSKTAICLRIAKPRQRISAFATDGLARRLNPLAPGDPDAVHRVERMAHTANQFGDFPIPKLPIMPGLGRISTAKPLITIATGAGARIKQYPHWNVVAEALLQRGFEVMFLGAGPDPRFSVPGTIDQVAKFTLAETMSAVASSTVHLAADTGTGHIAAAYGVPFVSVFGPTDPSLYRPYSEKGVVLRASRDPGDVTPDQILDEVSKLYG